MLQEKTYQGVSRPAGTQREGMTQVWRISYIKEGDIGEANHDRFQRRAFRVKPGRDQEFLDAHAKVQRNWPGLLHANIFKTGERTYCIIAEWVDMDSLANARPNMIATLDTFRDTLEDLGGGLGVTDPVSEPVVLSLK
jgi:hypothetical protein